MRCGRASVRCNAPFEARCPCRSASHRLASKIEGAILDPASFLEKELVLRAVNKLELCLVCEVCWRPQHDGAYDVTKKSDLCAKVHA